MLLDGIGKGLFVLIVCVVVMRMTTLIAWESCIKLYHQTVLGSSTFLII